MGNKLWRKWACLIACLTGTLFLTIIIPVLICDQFQISGVSMEPTLCSGDHVLVNKLLIGPRIYKNYDFKDPKMSCFRLPGMRNLRPGDIAVINCPLGRNNGFIQFKINYVFAKRCIGCPGDTISIVNGFYRNGRLLDKTIGVETLQMLLGEASDEYFNAQGINVNAKPFAPEYDWTIRNFGPLLIPGKGMSISITPQSVRLYERIIQFETGESPIVDGEKVLLNGKEIESYTFKKDYCFFGGDNVLNSQDSRYFGFVPYEYVIGVATRVLFSYNPSSRQIKWDRVWKKLK